MITYIKRCNQRKIIDLFHVFEAILKKPISSDSLPSGQACFSVIFPVGFCFINDYATLQLNNKITFSTLSVEVMDRQLPILAKAKVDGIHSQRFI